MILKFTLWLLKKRYNWVTVMVLKDGRLQKESGGDISILEMGMVSEACVDIQRDLLGIACRAIEIHKVEAGIV